MFQSIAMLILYDLIYFCNLQNPLQMPSLDHTSNFLSEKTARDTRESRDQHAKEDEDGHVSVTQIRVPCPSLPYIGHQVDHLIS